MEGLMGVESIFDHVLINGGFINLNVLLWDMLPGAGVRGLRLAPEVGDT